jgi:hypothetical protein
MWGGVIRVRSLAGPRLHLPLDAERKLLSQNSFAAESCESERTAKERRRHIDGTVPRILTASSLASVPISESYTDSPTAGSGFGSISAEYTSASQWPTKSDQNFVSSALQPV